MDKIESVSNFEYFQRIKYSIRKGYHAEFILMNVIKFHPTNRKVNKNVILHLYATSYHIL